MSQHVRRLSTAAAVTLVAAALTLLSGTAPAAAAPRTVRPADSESSLSTADGWTLTVRRSQETVRIESPLDNSPLSREAFWYLRGQAILTGNSAEPLGGGEFEIGLHVGCELDLSGGGAFGSSIGPTAQVTLSAAPGLTVGVTGQVSATANIKPGTITTLPVKRFPITERGASAGVGGIHVAVTGCLGAVSVRSYAMVSTATSTSQDTVTTLGPTVKL